MKIEDYIKSLPENIISGEDVQLPDHSFREIFEFVGLGEKDIFYHLGCGDGNGIAVALQKFNVKKAIGIDYNKEKIQQCNKLVKEKNLTRAKFLCTDIQTAKFDDATVILFWFTDNDLIENMMKKFKDLPDGCRIITLWGPLPQCLPSKVEFPYIVNQVPFKTANLKEQLLEIFDAKCMDFVTAWEYAERYTKAISSSDIENNRFLTILQSLIIWINAKNLGIACGNEIPIPIKNYMGILKTFFNIEVEHLLK
jgi:trans-aconitate methyltransferase